MIFEKEGKRRSPNMAQRESLTKSPTRGGNCDGQKTLATILGEEGHLEQRVEDEILVKEDEVNVDSDIPITQKDSSSNIVGRIISLGEGETGPGDEGKFALRVHAESPS